MYILYIYINLLYFYMFYELNMYEGVYVFIYIYNILVVQRENFYVDISLLFCKDIVGKYYIGIIL